VHQPFEPELAWPSFSLSVNQSDIPQLHTRLAAVDEAQLAQLQASLPCAAQHLMWSSLSGAFMEVRGQLATRPCSTAPQVNSAGAHDRTMPSMTRLCACLVKKYVCLRCLRGEHAASAALLPSGVECI
jgi:hypothetical protein